VHPDNQFDLSLEVQFDAEFDDFIPSEENLRYLVRQS
jgi:hypothetical protein